VPLGGENIHVHDSGTFVGTPEVSHELLVFLVAEDVHLSLGVVLERGVIVALLGDTGGSPHPDAHNLLLLLGSEDELSGEGPLSELVESLEETIAQVLSDVKNLTLISEHLVVEEPNGPALLVELFLKLINTFAFSVGFVDHEGLEVEQVEFGLGEHLKGRLGLLGGCKGINIVTILGLRGLLFGDNLLFLNLGGGLDGLGSGLDVTADSDELGESTNTLEPGGVVGHGLAETSVEDGLLGTDEVAANGDISKGDVVSDEPVLALKSNVKDLGVVLDGIHGDGVFSGGDLGGTVHGSHGFLALVEVTGDGPHDPLVNSCALLSVAAHKLGVTVGQVLGDSNGLADVSLGGDEHGVDSAIVNLLGLVVGNSNGDVLVVHLGSNASGEAHGVVVGSNVHLHLD